MIEKEVDYLMDILKIINKFTIEALGNYRTYFVDKLQYISEVKFEYEELLKLFKEDSNVEKIIEEDSGEND